MRAGIWSATDLAMGGLMAALVMEYTRKRHMALFVLNIVLILYAVYGWLVPGMFHHPGLSWTRVVERDERRDDDRRVLESAAARADADRLVPPGAERAARLRLHRIRSCGRPSGRHALAARAAAVGGGRLDGRGTVSGSGAANAITIGSATIPAMIGAGMPRATAAAIETASSLGGQLMPPVMGVVRLPDGGVHGRSYFEVVARGYAPAVIYYASVAVSVYLLSLRYRTRIGHRRSRRMRWRDWVNLAAVRRRRRRR